MMTNLLAGHVLDGWLPNDSDIEAPVLKAVQPIETPTAVDLRGHCSPVENQARIGSCVANAVVGALEYHQIKSGASLKDLSRLFVYYNARKLGERIGQSGTRSNFAIASVMAQGVCPAAMWPYQPAMVDVEPTPDCYRAAQNFTALQVAQVHWGTDCRQALANGFPLVFGMAVARPDFGAAYHSGFIRPPQNGQWHEAGGGHAMLMVGYDDAKNAWLVRNSWGEGFGDGGHVWIDYDYLERYTTGAGRGDHPLAIGEIAEHRAYSVSAEQTRGMIDQVLKHGSSDRQEDVSKRRAEIGQDLEQNIDETRKSIRDKLRGPGVGGGY